MVDSYTGTIQTLDEFVSVETLTGLTFTASKTYSMQIADSAYIKLGNAVFSFNNEKFEYKAGTEDMYIRTRNKNYCTLTILENENENA